MERGTLQSSANSSQTSRLAKYWAKHPERFSFPYNSRKFFDQWRKEKGELNVASFLKAFDFGYLEFGRWVKQNEREARFKGLAEGCLILSSNLFFDNSNLGCDRNINLAIGARGAGGKTLAHFEPAAMVINTTKVGGNHSFAHEYAHALDYFLGMHYDQSKKFNYLSGGHAALDTLKDNVGGELRRVTVEIVREAARQFETALGAKKFDDLLKEGDYWYRPNEIFARSFEAWVAYSFSRVDDGTSFNYRNSYLCKPLSAYSNKAIYPYKWDKLDELFIVWCVLVGKAMGDTALSKLPSIAAALKTAQARRSKFGKKTTKPAKPQPKKAKKPTTRQTKMTFDRKPPKTKKVKDMATTKKRTSKTTKSKVGASKTRTTKKKTTRRRKTTARKRK